MRWHHIFATGVNTFPSPNLMLFNGFLKNSKTPKFGISQKTNHYFNDVQGKNWCFVPEQLYLVQYFSYECQSYQWIQILED
jgi:hypothetical protein